MYTYTDLWGMKMCLTDAEIEWFKGVCIQCRKATGISIPINGADHAVLKGRSKEALGIFWTDDIENPLNENARITIDNYFIHECYEEVHYGKHNLSFDTLEHVIAHEYAHAYQWRHCKRHTQITEQLYNRIMNI